MAKGKKNSQDTQPSAPKSAEYARGGISTGADFANLMSALMSDIIEGRVTPNIGNATCKAAGQLLRVVELQMKYGTAGENGGKVLRLAMQTPLVASEQTQ
jgi:hypothetical protein